MLKIQQLASVLVVLALAAALLPASAEASLIGDTITAELFDDAGVSVFQMSALVGNGAEFLVDLGNGKTLRADFDDSSLALSFVGDGNYDPFRFVFSDLNWVGQSGEIVGITPISVPAESTVGGFSKDSFVILSDLGRLEGDPLTDTFRIDTRHIPNGNVPAPGVLVLLATGLVGLSRSRRRN